MGTEWMADGKCREVPPETFFPSDGLGVIRAQRICATCEVSVQCLEFALENGEKFGIWGGMSERERRRLRRARALERRAAAAPAS